MKYFLHDTSAFEDEKVTELFMQYGYEGIGLFYTILEKIGKQEKPVKTVVLKRQLQVGKRLEKCWSFMEEIGLISSNNGDTFNKQLLNFSEKYQIKKEKNAKRISDWREKQTVTENVTHYEHVRNTPKVNRSKVNRSKKNNNIVIPDEESGNIEPKVILPKKEVSLFTLMVAVWFEDTHPDFVFSPIDGKKINSIINKIRELLKKKKRVDTDDEILSFFKLVCQNLPEYYQPKDLKIIDSDFNTIVAEIKKQQDGNKQPKINHKQPAYDVTRELIFGPNA